MKKVIVTFVFVLLGISGHSQIKAGLHGMYSSVKNLGLGADVEYAFNDRWSIAPDFAYFFPTETTHINSFVKLINPRKETYWEMNVNTHYHFYNSDTFRIYGIAGLNYSRYSFKTESNIGKNPFFKVAEIYSESYGSTTVNLGVGGSFKINDFLELFSNLKHTFSLLGGSSIAIGVKHTF